MKNKIFLLSISFFILFSNNSEAGNSRMVTCPDKKTTVKCDSSNSKKVVSEKDISACIADLCPAEKTPKEICHECMDECKDKGFDENDCAYGMCEGKCEN